MSQPSIFRQVFSLSRDSVIYGLSTMMSQLIGFLLVPVYTDKLGTQGYGVMEILNTTSAVLGIILTMGLGTALLRFYAGREDEEEKRRVASTAVLFLVGVGLLALLVLELAGGSIASSVFRDPQRDRSHDAFFFRLLFISIFFNLGIHIALTVFRARGTPVRYAAASVTQFLMTVVLNILFVAGLSMGVLGVLYSELITSAFLFVVLVGSLLRRVGIRFSRQDLKAMLDYGVPLIPSGLGAWMLIMADRVILNWLVGLGATGVYSLGYKFGMVIQGILVGPIQLAWLPFLFSTARKPRANETYTRVFTYFAAVALFAALALSALGEELVMVMAAPSFHGSYKVIPLVALSYVLYGCYFQMAAGIYIEGKTRRSATLMVVAAAVNLALCFALIPPFGIMGAAVATLVAYALLPAGAYFLSRPLYHIDYEWGRVIRLVLVTALVFGACLAAGAAVSRYLVRSTDDDGVLQVGETWTWTCTYAATQADIDSAGGGDGDIDLVATVSSDQMDGRRDTGEVPILRNAAVSIDLAVTDVGGNGADGLADAEYKIAYEAVVTNAGTVPLTGVVVTSDNTTPLDPADDFEARFAGGDTDGDGQLGPAETWTWTYRYTTTREDVDSDGGGDFDIDNTATVSCRELPGRSDSVAVPMAVDRGVASCSISLAVTDVGGDGPDGLVDAAGDVITFEVVVTNTGDASLTGVSLAGPLVEASGVVPVESGAVAKWPRVLVGGALKVVLILAFPVLLVLVGFFRPDEMGLVKQAMGAVPGMAAKLLRRRRPS